MKFISRSSLCHLCIMACLSALIFTSCQKEISGTTDPSNGNTPSPSSGAALEAKINGKLVVFNQVTATLLRSTPDNLKRLDIYGVSSDGKNSLIVTLGDTPATGNGIAVKEYVINLFNEDDPATAVDESEGNDNGFITWSEKFGNGWITDVYAQTGLMKVTSCDANARKVTGTFTVKNTSLTSSTVISFTEGKFNNIPYTVLN